MEGGAEAGLVLVVVMEDWVEDTRERRLEFRGGQAEQDWDWKSSRIIGCWAWNRGDDMAK